MLGVPYLSEPEAQHQQWTLEHRSESPRDSATTVETEPADDLYWLQIFRKKNIYINSDSNKSNNWQGLLLFSDSVCFTSWSLLCFCKPRVTSKCYLWPTAQKYLFQLFYVMMMMWGVFTPSKNVQQAWIISMLKYIQSLYVTVFPSWPVMPPSPLKRRVETVLSSLISPIWQLENICSEFVLSSWFHLCDSWRTFVVKLCYRPDVIYTTAGEHL